MKIGIYSGNKLNSARFNIAFAELEKNPPSDVLNARKMVQDTFEEIINLLNRLKDKNSYKGQIFVDDMIQDMEYVIDTHDRKSVKKSIEMLNLYHKRSWGEAEIDMPFRDDTLRYFGEATLVLEHLGNSLSHLEEESKLVLKRHKSRISIDVETKVQAAFNQVCRDENFGLVLDASVPLYIGSDAVNMNDMVSLKLNDL